MFTGTTFTSGGNGYIVIANSTPLTYSADFGYIILPNYTHSANYTGFFKDSIFDTEIRCRLFSLVDSDTKTNYSNMFENATFTSSMNLEYRCTKKLSDNPSKGLNLDKLFYNSIFQSRGNISINVNLQGYDADA